MSDFTKQTPNQDDWRDRALDHALREVVGGQTPPDLSQRILTAAESPATTTAEPHGDEAMAEQSKRTGAGTRKLWASLAIAASLLVAAGLLLPLIYSAKRLTGRASSSSTRAVSDELSSSRDSGARTSDSGREAKRNESGDASRYASQPGADDSLTMMVTPHIVISEEEEGNTTLENATVARELIGVRQPSGAVPTGGAATNGHTQPMESGLGLQSSGVDDGAVVDYVRQKPSFGFQERGGEQNQGLSAYLSEADRSLGEKLVADSYDVSDLDAHYGGAPHAETKPNPGAPASGATVNQPAVMFSEPTRSDSVALDVGQRFRITAGPSPLGSEATPALIEAKESQLAPQSGVEAHSRSALLAVATPKERQQLVELEVSARVAFEDQRRSDPEELVRRESLLSKLQSRVDAKVQSGIGPGESGDKYERIVDNPFKSTAEENLSTFSIDVDTASYANMRQFLLQSGQLPPADAVRVEELINYFDYGYSPPTDDTPFAAHLEAAACPWNSEHRLVRIGIKGRVLLGDSRPQSNLVFLIDVSGSMNEPAKLPLLVEGMKMLSRELSENDRVAIVVYASSEGLALPSTLGTEQQTILAALERLRAGGSTAGGAGIQLAYETAQQHFVEGGVNRVILCTDGDFNVGVTSPAELERLAEEKAKETGVALTVLGFGRGNLNDLMMEKISGKGNGNYYYIDGRTEAEKVLVAEMAGTLVTIAKDVKIQVDFNPAQVAGYRLIGYANRMLNKEDFNDDKKDAGEIGAGHTVTALYEIVPAGKQVPSTAVDESKYVRPADLTSEATESEELLTVRMRYKQPDGDVSTKVEFPLTDHGQEFAAASDDFRFASAVASFGMLLRGSEHAGDASLAGVEEIAGNSIGEQDERGYRAEFLTLLKRARELRGE